MPCTGSIGALSSTPGGEAAEQHEPPQHPAGRPLAGRGGTRCRGPATGTLTHRPEQVEDPERALVPAGRRPGGEGRRRQGEHRQGDRPGPVLRAVRLRCSARASPGRTATTPPSRRRPVPRPPRSQRMTAPDTLRKRAQSRYPGRRGPRPRPRPADEEAPIPDAAPHPGGDGRPPAALLPGAARDRRSGDRHGLVGAPGRAGRASTRPRCARTSPTSAPTAPGASGYDVEYLLHEISRELGLTHDWPVVIVGVGNLGPGPRQLPGLRRPRLPDRRAGRRRPREGRRARRRAHHRVARRPARRSPAAAGVAIGIIATPAARGPGGGRPPRRRRRHVDPQLRADGGRPCPPACRCARSTSRSSCRSSPSTNSGATRRRRATESRNGDRRPRRDERRPPVADRRSPGTR